MGNAYFFFLREGNWNRGDPGLIPGSGRSPGEETGSPLQYSCLENPKERGTWWATVHGVTRIGHYLALSLFLSLRVESNGDLASSLY